MHPAKFLLKTRLSLNIDYRLQLYIQEGQGITEMQIRTNVKENLERQNGKLV